MAVFPQLNETTSYSLPFVYAEVGGHFALPPSYNISIDVSPKIKYQYAIAPVGVEMSDFDGFSVGIGISVNYRFGENPDSASALIRSIRFAETDLPSVFAAMQSYYIDNPVGTVAITEADDVAVSRDYAYIASGSFLRIFDISNPSALVETGSFDLSGVRHLMVSGDYVYALNPGNLLYVVDISDPAASFAIDELLVKYYIEDVDVSGEYAYTVGTSGLAIIDLYPGNYVQEVYLLNIRLITTNNNI